MGMYKKVLVCLSESYRTVLRILCNGKKSGTALCIRSVFHAVVANTDYGTPWYLGPKYIDMARHGAVHTGRTHYTVRSQGGGRRVSTSPIVRRRRLGGLYRTVLRSVFRFPFFKGTAGRKMFCIMFRISTERSMEHLGK